MLFISTKNAKNTQYDSHAEAQRSRHVCLPVGAVEHEHPGEAAEEHPVGVCAHLHRDAGSQHHEHCRDTARGQRQRLHPSVHLKEEEEKKKKAFRFTGEREGTDPWRASRSRGRTARPAGSCCWCVGPASRRWRPATGR